MNDPFSMLSFRDKVNVMTAFVLFVNGIWYLCKYLLNKNGIEVSWFTNHWQDIPNMLRLAVKTENNWEKYLYYALPVILIGGVPGIIALMFLLFIYGNISM